MPVFDTNTFSHRSDSLLMIAGKYQFKPSFPFSPGMEVGGVISAVGEGVSGFRPGDRVMAMTSMGGGYAEQAIAKAAKTFLLPDAVTFEQAAVGIAHVSTDGRWLSVNDKLCEIVGYPRPELLRLTFQDITHPEDLDADLEHGGADQQVGLAGAERRGPALALLNRQATVHHCGAELALQLGFDPGFLPGGRLRLAPLLFPLARFLGLALLLAVLLDRLGLKVWVLFLVSLECHRPCQGLSGSGRSE